MGDKAKLLGVNCWFMDMPIVSGHNYVSAWYMGMGGALSAWASALSESDRDDALARVACLLECGLTVTVHAMECVTDGDLASFSIDESEKGRVERDRAGGGHYRAPLRR